MLNGEQTIWTAYWVKIYTERFVIAMKMIVLIMMMLLTLHLVAHTHIHTHTHKIYTKRARVYIYCIYIQGVPGGMCQNRVFLMLNYTDITQNTYVQS